MVVTKCPVTKCPVTKCPGVVSSKSSRFLVTTRTSFPRKVHQLEGNVGPDGNGNETILLCQLRDEGIRHQEEKTTKKTKFTGGCTDGKEGKEFFFSNRKCGSKEQNKKNEGGATFRHRNIWLFQSRGKEFFRPVINTRVPVNFAQLP